MTPDRSTAFRWDQLVGFPMTADREPPKKILKENTVVGYNRRKQFLEVWSPRRESREARKHWVFCICEWGSNHFQCCTIGHSATSPSRQKPRHGRCDRCDHWFTASRCDRSYNRSSVSTREAREVATFVKSSKKAQEPYSDFPLTSHTTTRQWCKIQGAAL